jgi:hypothetical protein
MDDGTNQNIGCPTFFPHPIPPPLGEGTLFSPQRGEAGGWDAEQPGYGALLQYVKPRTLTYIKF